LLAHRPVRRTRLIALLVLLAAALLVLLALLLALLVFVELNGTATLLIVTVLIDPLLFLIHCRAPFLK